MKCFDDAYPAHVPPFTMPSGYHRIKVVKSFEELVGTRFEDGINALCWERMLPGNFSEVVEQLVVSEGIDTLDEARLQALSLSAAGKVARDILIRDQELLRSFDLLPNLDCVQGCRRDLSGGPVPTDVFSFHVDSATDVADTYLCSYTVAASEGLRNDEAVRRVDVPETRAELLKVFGGEDNAEFLEYLNENCYDLHYAPLPGAQPFSFGLGNLWRIAIEFPDCPVPPCIHRAPTTLAGQPPRLLLIS
jgi:hypothetical protein